MFNRNGLPAPIRVQLQRKLVGLALLCLASVWLAQVFLTVRPALFGQSSLHDLALQVLVECGHESYPPSCYDEAIPELMDRISMEETFEVTKIIQNYDPRYLYCHVLGHNVSAVEVAKDPSKWKDVLARCPSGVCSNGCLHGGLQEKFRADVLTEAQIVEVTKEMQDICEARPGFSPTGLEQASCYHAVGHLTMYVTNADITRALEICDQVALKPDGRDFLRVCQEGVFMQIFQPLEPEDIALVEGITPQKDQLKEFCWQFPEPERHACWREGWPLYDQEIRQPSGLLDFCQYSSDPRLQAYCFNSMFYIITPQFQFSLPKLDSFCAEFPEMIAAQCYGNAASRMMETDWKMIPEALALCQLAGQQGLADRCYQELVFYSQFNFRPDSTQFQKLCNGLPEPWQTKCFSREKVRLYPQFNDEQVAL